MSFDLSLVVALVGVMVVVVVIMLLLLVVMMVMRVMLVGMLCQAQQLEILFHLLLSTRFHIRGRWEPHMPAHTRQRLNLMVLRIPVSHLHLPVLRHSVSIVRHNSVHDPPLPIHTVPLFGCVQQQLGACICLILQKLLVHLHSTGAYMIIDAYPLVLASLFGKPHFLFS